MVRWKKNCVYSYVNGHSGGSQLPTYDFLLEWSQDLLHGFGYLNSAQLMRDFLQLYMRYASMV